MKHLLVAMLMGSLLGATALAQSTTPADPGAQPPAAQPVPQTSQPATTPAPGGASSQSANSESAESSNPKRLAAGSVIPVQLTKTVDAKKAKTGDQVVAKVTQDMKATNGQVVVAKDTKVIGHVTEAQARSKEQKESELGVAFDHAVTKDGQELQMPMSIQAVIGQQNNQAAAAGNDQGAPAAPGGPASGNPAGRSPVAGSSPQAPSGSPSGGNAPSDNPSANAARPPINAQTQGVIGISNLQLQPASGTQGSVMTSEKNNVKLESGTMLLLKVNQ